MIKSPVTTICAGLAASMGAVLLSGGTKGKRYSMKNGKILIHQVLGGVGGQATNMDIHTKDMLKTKRLLNGILAENTGKTMEDVTRDTERDYILNAEEAVAYVEKLKGILEYIGVSDCKMQEGSLRADVNLSLRPVGQEKFGTRTETKIKLVILTEEGDENEQTASCNK